MCGAPVLRQPPRGSRGLSYWGAGKADISAQDLCILEELHLLAADAAVVADNVLKPGAPLSLRATDGA